MPELRIHLRQRVREDRGAVATVVAILMAGGVLLGFLALVIDVGQLYVEREELQTGADAAALAVARACAINATECASGIALTAVAQTYADSNSHDNRSQVVAVCGRLSGKVQPCPDETGNLTDCIGTVPADPTPYLEVRLATQIGDDKFALPPIFAQTLAGNAGYEGAAVAACARATWTARAAVTILALTVSTCDYIDATTGPAPDPADLRPTDERQIALVPGHDNCGPGQAAPWQRPGPAAWLTGNSACQVVLPVGGMVTGTLVGAETPTPAGCEDQLRTAQGSRAVVYVPVYDRLRTNSPDPTYHHISLAPFIVTGWKLGPTATPSVGPSTLSATPDEPCGTTMRCVAGVFVGDPVPLSGVAAGAAIVRLIG